MKTPLTNLQMRLLIRNDEERVSQYQQMLDRCEDEAPADLSRMSIRLSKIWQAALERLARNRARLAGREILSECVTALPGHSQATAGQASPILDSAFSHSSAS